MADTHRLLDLVDAPLERAFVARRIGIVTIALLVYGAAFYLGYPVLGRSIGTLAMFPILLAAHFFGVPGGLIVGVVCFPLNTLLLHLAGSDELLATSRILTLGVLVLFGLASGVIRNVTLRGRRSEDRLHIALQAAQDGLWDYRVDRDEAYFSPRWFTMLGYEPDELPHAFDTWVDLLHPKDRNEALDTVERVLHGGQREFSITFRMREKSGDWKWILARGQVVELDDEGRVRRLVGVHSDVTRLKQAESELVHLAYHDQLTDLPNRKAFYERAEQALAQAHRSHANHLCAVLLIDLDNFKDVNDSLGHDIGDELLVQAGNRLRERLRRSDLLFRLGGDEFTVVLTELEIPTHAALVASNLIRSFSEAFEVQGYTVYTALSVGIAIFPRDGTTVGELARKADTALNASKRERNTYRFYTLEMQQQAVRKMDVINSLRTAIENHEFRMHYQPILDREGRIRGAEALLRWQDPQGRLRSPAEFIPIAEETGLIVRIGRWVLAQAATDAQRWREQGLGEVRISVNVAPRQLRHRSLMDDLDLVLTASELPPRLLGIELTERSLVDPTDESTERLRLLRSRGVSVAIDDFGTGYSSMSYLKMLPVDTIKIDRSFVVGLPAVPEDVSIVQAVITMAHGLGLSVVAEGVDAEEQVAFLAGLGCDLYQGFHFSKPLPAPEFERLLAHGTQTSRPIDRATRA